MWEWKSNFVFRNRKETAPLNIRLKLHHFARLETGADIETLCWIGSQDPVIPGLAGAIPRSERAAPGAFMQSRTKKSVFSVLWHKLSLVTQFQRTVLTPSLQLVINKVQILFCNHFPREPASWHVISSLSHVTNMSRFVTVVTQNVTPGPVLIDLVSRLPSSYHRHLSGRIC